MPPGPSPADTDRPPPSSFGTACNTSHTVSNPIAANAAARAAHREMRAIVADSLRLGRRD